MVWDYKGNMETRHYWEENGHAVKYENYNSNDGFARGGGAGTAGASGCADQLNFAAVPSEDEDYPPGYMKKGKVSRQDLMSHRIIEKRRRDRMNNCLADLSRLIPPEYLKKGRGRVEKTEIIEMAIRHLKYLQDRVNGLYNESQGKSEYESERSSVSEGESYRAGYQQAVGEAVRFLVEVQGYGPGDGLCAQLASHLQRQCDHITKVDSAREKPRHAGSSSETASSSSSSHGYKPSVIARAEPAPPRYDYEPDPAPAYTMECDRGDYEVSSAISLAPEEQEGAESPAEPLDARRRREPTLRTVRKPENEDYLHSYKFKNSIERRFSRSQDCEAHDMSGRSTAGPAPGKQFTHKRRRAGKPVPPPASAGTSLSGSGSTEDGTSARDTSPQDTSSESPHHHYEQKASPSQYVPVFALNALGKYYVPLSVEYACLARHPGAFAALDARAATRAAPLHPVAIHVNFTPCLGYHATIKREQERDWRE